MNDWPSLVPVALSELRFQRIRFELEAEEDVRLPEYLGSTLRGALAMAFRRMVCTYDMRPCDGCPVQRTCLYPRLFETPQATGTQDVKRMRDIPHPIIIEPPMHHPRHYRPGYRLSFEVVLIGEAVTALPYLLFAVNEMAPYGLGAQRRPFRLVLVVDEGGEPIYDPENGTMLGRGKAAAIGERFADFPPCDSLDVVFETPLRMKAGGSLMGRVFDGDAFFRGVCRRLSALIARHENRSYEDADFLPLLKAVPCPRVDAANVHWKDLDRYSNRQKSKLKIGGLIGKARLVGIQPEWRPVLSALSELHAGKGTIMGLGRVAFEEIPSMNESVVSMK